MTYFYAIEYEGKVIYEELDSFQQAQKEADSWYISLKANRGMYEGEESEDTCEIVCTYLNEEGVGKEISRTSYPLYYQEYHGDLAEHRTY